MIRLLMVIFALLVPEMAMADALIRPPGGDTWDLYVFGNARVIADTLESIKLLMAPEEGSTGYATLMLFMATLGFLVLAVRAGFNPSQGFVPMFTYILVAWVVSWGTTTLKVNVHVIDSVDRNDSVRVVQKAPAIVALPAVLVSGVGNYFTKTIESYFKYPAASGDLLKVTGDRANGFNIFNRMMMDATRYNITSTPLKQSLRSYMADCTVPAIAAGRFEGTTLTSTGSPVAVYGLDALLKSDNLVETLSTAGFRGIYAKYYPIDAQQAARANSLAKVTFSEKDMGANGVLLPCDEAYSLIKEDLQNHANALFAGSSEAWSKTGTMVQLDATFNAMLGAVGSVGSANRFASMSSPQTFIAQQAVINSMSGAFRQAATQTGNNEYLTAANLAQAEQNQKSAWVAGAEIFNNMMGYFYSVLQAFIFAMMPIVVIALFIPGLGKGIFTNYAQILVWLALWSPMLAIINYLVTIFGYEQVGTIYTLNGGPNYMNTALVSEKTNNLVIAAQFLGVSTPLITWGLVKGALAFTEFIQQGVGSSFAQQAGASAASGNLSMGNISMDNTSMNKFNTASQATVGFQQTAAFSGQGALLNSAHQGGSGVEANGKAVGNDNSISAERARSFQISESVTQTLSLSASQGWSKQQTFDYAAQSMSSQQFQQFLNESQKAGINYADEHRVAKNRSADESRQVGENLNAALAATGNANAGISLQAGASVGLQANLQKADTFNRAHGYRESTDEGRTGSTSRSGGRDSGQGSGWTRSVDGSTSVRVGDGQSVTWGQQLQSAIGYSQQTTDSAQESLRESQTFTHANSTTVADMHGRPAALDPRGQLREVEQRLEEGRAFHAAGVQAVEPARALNPTDQSGMQNFGAARDAAQARVDAGTTAVTEGKAAVQGAQLDPATAQAEAERKLRSGGLTIDGGKEVVDIKAAPLVEHVGEGNNVIGATGAVMNGIISPAGPTTPTDPKIAALKADPEVARTIAKPRGGM